MERAYRSVTDMLKGLEVEKQFVEQVREEIEDRNLIRLLIALRCKAGITQKQLSEKMHCGQSRISKFENSKDRSLNLGEILDYAGALGLNLEIGLLPEMTIAEKIKMHALQVKGLLEKLCKLSKDDKEITNDVLQFHAETFSNFVQLVINSAKKLTDHKKSSGNLSISTSIDLAENIANKEVCT
ncbi:MAG TPA: helix-turn-helix transcriptional regulator [Chitinispirillaceae bacterium]|nr:helix-turn-helix transcriptional regulator [Chitinispirillaceae bacterium]